MRDQSDRLRGVKAYTKMWEKTGPESIEKYFLEKLGSEIVQEKYDSKGQRGMMLKACDISLI